MEDSKRSLMQKLGPEAVVTVVIASIAVLITVVAFRQHTIDFEKASHQNIQRIESRITSLEERERSNTQILTRVDTHVEALREDIAYLQRQVSTILTRLPLEED